MSETLITWSVKNWITIFLMWLLGWAVISLVARLARNNIKLPHPADTAAGAFVGNAPVDTDPMMV